MKKIASILMAASILTTIVACSEDPKTVTSKEMTLNFAFGERAGVYTGEIDDNGIPNGTGTFKAKNTEGTGWTYEGDWVNGHWNGEGTSIWDSGTKYSGSYRDDYANGYGEIVLDNGDKYAGNFNNGEINGYGEYTFSSGTKYIGNMIKGAASGQGDMYYYDSDVQRHFTGEFKDNQNAVGYIIYNDGSKRKASINNGNVSFTEKVKPKIGMTAAEVYSSTWGAPLRTNKTTTSYGVSEQWVYDKGYITFSDGVVTAIQEMG